MLLPACPPGAVLSSTSVRSPSDAPYTAAASPAGPAPTTIRSYSVCSTGRRMPIRSASSRFDGLRRSSMLLHAIMGVSAFVVDRDGLRLVAGIIDDFHLAGLDDEEFEVAVADREQRLPVAVGLRRDTAAAAQVVDERLLEGREGDGMKVVFGHGYSSSQK